MSTYSDDDQISFPKTFPNRLSDDIRPDSFRYQEREHERLRNEHRFLDMNKRTHFYS